jgi:hypothetical protein
MAGIRFTRFFERDDEQELGPVETDEEVRRAMARIDRYGAARPLDRSRPEASEVHPLGKVISLWPH